MCVDVNDIKRACNSGLYSSCAVERRVEPQGTCSGSSARPWDPRWLSVNENVQEVHGSA